MEEQAEDRESTKSDVKLGRLQFRIDYDFNQSNVSRTLPSLFVVVHLATTNCSCVSVLDQNEISWQI